MKLIKSILFTILIFGTVSAHGDKLAHLRTAKKIITVHEITAPYYTIQIVALKEPPGNAEFFCNVDLAREFISADGYVRYTVGEYSTFAAAARDLDQIKALGYNDAFVLNLRHISLRHNDYEPAPTGLVVDPNHDYTIQLAAFRYPVYVSEFEEFDNVKEFYMQDRIYRYTVGRYSGDIALQELERVKRQGYPDAFLVRYDRYVRYRIE